MALAWREANLGKQMKYIVGSLIISFGIIFFLMILLASLQVKAPEGSMKYLGAAWLVLAAAMYPVAKRLIRD